MIVVKQESVRSTSNETEVGVWREARTAFIGIFLTHLTFKPTSLLKRSMRPIYPIIKVPSRPQGWNKTCGHILFIKHVSLSACKHHFARKNETKILGKWRQMIYVYMTYYVFTWFRESRGWLNGYTSTKLYL